MPPTTSKPVRRLAGTAAPPGDKSISHRAVMLGGLAVGRTVVHGLLEGADVLATAAAMRALGARVERDGDGAWVMEGRGVGGLCAPLSVLDMGNSGTGARLLMGLLASHPFRSLMTGDASLRARPMGRVAEPLRLMGAQIQTAEGGRLPAVIDGAAAEGLPVPITWPLQVPSAQVKSAILLAGLNTPGRTTVIESRPTRDHTERLLGHFGAQVTVTEANDGRHVAVTGHPELTGAEVTVPTDPSSAAFALAGALVTPDSEVTMTGVGVNPLRAGLLETLREMGADLTLAGHREVSGEPVADITARSSALGGIEVAADRAPTMIDEYPILAVAAACAKGTTVLRGLGELRVKESDRLAAIARGLALCGVDVDEGDDSLTIEGCGGPPPGIAGDDAVATHMDHRIAMSFLVLGMAARNPVRVDDAAMIETSFPGFAGFMNRLGAKIAP